MKTQIIIKYKQIVGLNHRQNSTILQTRSPFGPGHPSGPLSPFPFPLPELPIDDVASIA